MALLIARRVVLLTSKELLEGNMVAIVNALKQQQQQQQMYLHTLPLLSSNYNNNNNRLVVKTSTLMLLPPAVLQFVRQYAKKPAVAETLRREDSDSDSDSDDEFERRRQNANVKHSKRGDSEFWRRKMRTLHRIMDVNHDGIISYDDFNLLAKRFSDLGHLSPEVALEFTDVIKQTWEEQFGEITPYNLKTAEQFLTDLHHRLNDNKMAKRIGRFLPYLFKAVDFDHTGYLDLEQYKLFFRCLGLSDEDAAISFAVIDKNGDGQLSLKEFVHLGRQFFLSEDDTKISKMFWGPLIADH